MQIIDLQQGSQEWLKYRAGRATGSRIADIIARTKSGPSASRQNYLSQLVVERLTGTPVSSFQNEAMRLGTEREPQARLAYEVLTGTEVRQVGIIQHPSLEMSCSSPDGLVSSDGAIEIKCPTHATHLETLLSDKDSSVPSKYVAQIQWLMACSSKAIQWTDFISYNPDFPAELQLYTKRIYRDDKFISEVTEQVAEFLDEVSQTVDRVRNKYSLREAA